MQFDSLSALLHMDGHGVYVWSIVIVSALVIVGLLLIPALSSRRFLTAQRTSLQAAPQAAAPEVRIEEVNNAPGP